MMGTIAPPVLPEYFYRYRSLGEVAATNIMEREVDAIVKGYIYCADFLKLNDPMEGDFALTARLMKRPEAQQVLDAISSGQTSVGIASLSDTLNNDLMWTHYANDWSGICIQYHAQRLVNALPNDTTVVRMAYNEKPSWVGVRDTSNLDEAVKKVFSQKKFNWAYEREWRVLGRKGRNSLSDKKAIKCVYFGPRFSLVHSPHVREALDTARIRYRQIEVNSYSLKEKPFKPLRRF